MTPPKSPAIMAVAKAIATTESAQTNVISASKACQRLADRERKVQRILTPLVSVFPVTWVLGVVLVPGHELNLLESERLLGVREHSRKLVIARRNRTKGEVGSDVSSF